MIVNKYNQAKCDAPCGSWHFALQLSPDKRIVEIKCTRCGKIHNVTDGIVTEIKLRGKLDEEVKEQ